jgi:hypothetical protein
MGSMLRKKSPGGNRAEYRRDVSEKRKLTLALLARQARPIRD